MTNRRPNAQFRISRPGLDTVAFAFRPAGQAPPLREWIRRSRKTRDDAALSYTLLPRGYRIRSRRTGITVEVARTRQRTDTILVSAPLAVLCGSPRVRLAPAADLPYGCETARRIANDYGVPASGEATVARVDLAADVLFRSRAEAVTFLSALQHLRVPHCQSVTYRAVGSSAPETVAFKRGNSVVFRAYDRSAKRQRRSFDFGWTRVRLERQIRERRPRQKSPIAVARADMAGQFLRPVAIAGIAHALAVTTARDIFLNIEPRIHAAADPMTELKGERLMGAALRLAFGGAATFSSRKNAKRRLDELRVLGLEPTEDLYTGRVEVGAVFAAALLRWADKGTAR